MHVLIIVSFKQANYLFHIYFLHGSDSEFFRIFFHVNYLLRLQDTLFGVLRKIATAR